MVVSGIFMAHAGMIQKTIVECRLLDIVEAGIIRGIY